MEVSEPELGKVPRNCGKHLHTQILAQNQPPVLYRKSFIINLNEVRRIRPDFLVLEWRLH